MLADPDIIKVAETGRIFTADLNGDLPRAAHVYRMTQDGREYIAVFNFSGRSSSFSISIGDENKTYNIKELWSGEEFAGSGNMKVRLNAKDSALYEITEQVNG